MALNLLQSKMGFCLFFAKSEQITINKFSEGQSSIPEFLIQLIRTIAKSAKFPVAYLS